MAHASGYPLQGRLTFQGLKISIENRKGSYREDKAHTPPQWRTKMCCHYGYVLGTEGVDGDHIDVFIGPNPHAEFAYIVRQVRPDTGAFDEQKVMLGFNSAREAKEMYLRHYDTPKFFGGLHAMPMEQFKHKVMNTLHGEKLLKSLRRGHEAGEDCSHCGACLERGDDGNCNSCGKPWPLEKSLESLFGRFCKSLDVLRKSRVEGHFRATQGGKQVWVESYDDKRVLHTRPENEQAPRAGDSLPLFPEIGYVRPLPEAPKPKRVAATGAQLSMEFKSIEAQDSDLNGTLDGTLDRPRENPSQENAPVLVYARPGLEESIAAAAMLCALKEACEPREVVAIAARKRAQAAQVATMFYDGLVSDTNLGALQSATGMTPATFRLVLARLRDELHNSQTQNSEEVLPLAPLQIEAPAVTEIPL